MIFWKGGRHDHGFILCIVAETMEYSHFLCRLLTSFLSSLLLNLLNFLQCVVSVLTTFALQLNSNVCRWCLIRTWGFIWFHKAFLSENMQKPDSWTLVGFGVGFFFWSSHSSCHLWFFGQPLALDSVKVSIAEVPPKACV